MAQVDQQILDEEDGTLACGFVPSISQLRHPVEVGSFGVVGREGENAFWAWPLSGPLLFENEASDCRDHCANERTYLKFSIYMIVVSVAIVLSFHLKQKASDFELRMAKPLGSVFWALSLASLGVGIANYMRTVNKYSRRAAIVQTGWKTQTLMACVATAIVVASLILLVVSRESSGKDS